MNRTALILSTLLLAGAITVGTLPGGLQVATEVRADAGTFANVTGTASLNVGTAPFVMNISSGSISQTGPSNLGISVASGKLTLGASSYIEAQVLLDGGEIDATLLQATQVNAGGNVVLNSGGITTFNGAGLNLSAGGYIADTVQIGATNDYLMNLGGRMEIDGGATIAAVTLDGGLKLIGNCISDATHLCPPVTIDNANGGQLEALDVKSNGVPWWRIGTGGHDINLVTGGLVVNNFNACLQSTGAASGIAPGADKASTISVTTGTTVGVCAADTALFRVTLQNGYSSTGYIVLIQSRGTQSAFTTSAYHAIPASATAFDVYNDTAVTLAGATTYVLQFVTVGGTATY